jgi:dolichol-phosphate mannosyltransferase
MKFLIITPTYNEIETIDNHLSSISLVRNHFSSNHEIEVLIVDDNSPDGTSLRVNNATEEWQHLLFREKKQGLGAAYKAGFVWAKSSYFDFIVEMDADGSHTYQDLIKIVNHDFGIDLVIGSRWVSGGSTEHWSTLRIWISKIGNRYVRFMLNSNVHDSTSGFRRYNAKKMMEIDLSEIAAQGYAFQVEMVQLAEKNKFSIEEIPINFVERTKGKSKMTLNIVIEAIWIVFKLRLKE